MISSPKPWALLSRHGHALLHLAANPRMRLTDLARDMDMTERSIRLLIGSLNRTEFLQIVKTGRNNSYALNYELELPHPFERTLSLKRIVDLAMEKKDA
jgi:DNA-binding IclR family transcriptional regulator